MLTFNLKKEWFEKIKSGEKTHEYREIKDYWVSRIGKELSKYGKHFDIEFVLGYAPKEDMSKRIYAWCKDISWRNGLETDLKIDKDVYDIEFELIQSP